MNGTYRHGSPTSLGHQTFHQSWDLRSSQGDELHLSWRIIPHFGSLKSTGPVWGCHVTEGSRLIIPRLVANQTYNILSIYRWDNPLKGGLSNLSLLVNSKKIHKNAAIPPFRPCPKVMARSSNAWVTERCRCPKKKGGFHVPQWRCSMI